jgi:hypothetical protein
MSTPDPSSGAAGAPQAAPSKAPLWENVRATPTFILAAMAISAFVAGFAVSQKIVVERLQSDHEMQTNIAEAEHRAELGRVKNDLERQTKLTAHSPELRPPHLSAEDGEDGVRIWQHFTFRDPEGDASSISFVLLQSDVKDIDVTSESVDIAAAKQISGTSWAAPWRCKGRQYRLLVRAYMSDEGGNVSLPQDYVLRCTATADAWKRD